MKELIIRSINFLHKIGFDAIKFFSNIYGFPTVYGEYLKIKKENKKLSSPWIIKFHSINYTDRKLSSGEITHHYFWQDLYIAQKIFLANPEKTC